MNLHRRLPFFYGWVITGVCFIAFAIRDSPRLAFSVYYVAFLQEFGWSRGTTATALSLLFLTQILTISLIGWVTDRHGARRVMGAGTVILSLGLALCSLTRSMGQLYLFFGIVVGLGVAGVGFPQNQVLISNWFHRYRGTAFGVAIAGIGVGAFVLIPFLQYIILTLGWRQAFLVQAGLSALLLPLILLLIRERPEELGLPVDGLRADPAPQPGLNPTGNGPAGLASPAVQGAKGVNGVVGQWAATDWTLRQAMGTHQFWLVFTVFVLQGFSTYLIATHQVAYVVEVGYSKMMAAAVFGFAAVLRSGGSFWGGYLSDRIGREWAYTLSTSVYSLGILSLILARFITGSLLPLYLYILFYGLGVGAAAAISTTVQSDLFHGHSGGRHFGAIASFISLGFALGGAIGPWAGGTLYDRLGNYTVAFALVIALMMVTTASLWIMAPRRVHSAASPQRRSRSDRTRSMT